MSIQLLALVLLIAGLVVAFASLKRREQDELYRLLQRQAAKRGGQAKPGTLLYYPKLTLSHEGVELTASALLGGRRPDRRSATTYVTFPLAVPPGGGFCITKKTTSLQTLVDRQLRGSPIRTGNPAFDDVFAIEGKGAATAQRFLTDEMQRRLLAFEETVDVRFERDRFTVKVDGIVKKEATLDRMLDLTLLAHGALRRAAAAPGPCRRGFGSSD